MVKRKACDTADESDVDVVNGWKEEAATSRSFTRGKYKTYRGVACKTKDEKKAAQAAAHKRWRMAKKTTPAIKFDETRKQTFTKTNQTKKTKASKRQVEQIAQLKTEAAQLRAENAKLKKAPGTSKALDVYRRTLYNEMLDNHVNWKKLNFKVIHRAPIEWYTHDNTFNPSIALLRAFVRRRMTKSPGKLEASRYPEE